MFRKKTVIPDWIMTKDQLPPEGEAVVIMDSGGHMQEMVYQSNMWWFPDFKMYAYYTPTSWRFP